MKYPNYNVNEFVGGHTEYTTPCPFGNPRQVHLGNPNGGQSRLPAMQILPRYQQGRLHSILRHPMKLYYSFIITYYT